jgi:pyruvate ferredoxin oxidoreductase gamma subunit
MEPDVLVVLDPGLLHVGDVVARLKKEGTAVINTKKTHAEMRSKLTTGQLATVDALAIAKEVLGLPIVNTTMLGALVKATGIVDLASLEEPLHERFGKLAVKNLEAMRRAYDETVVG